MKTSISKRDMLKLSSILGVGGLLTLGNRISEPLAEQMERQQAGKSSGIKITDLEQFQVEIPWPKEEIRNGKINSFEVMKIKTTEGITGYAFDRFDRGLRGVYFIKEKYSFQEKLDKVRSIIIGQDPFAVEQFLEQFEGQGLETYGIVEHALWDIMGKAANMPVHKLLGGNKKKTRYYMTFVWPGKDDMSDTSPEKQAEDILRYNRQGYNNIKVRAYRKNSMDDVEVAKLVMAKAAPGFILKFDRCAQYSGQVWTYEEAYRVAKGMQDAGVYWLEEPFEEGDMTKSARLAKAFDMLITGAEHSPKIRILSMYAANDVFDVIQPDCFWTGGILNIKKIGAIAQAFGKQCIPHGTRSLSLFGWLQANAALTNCDYQEIATLTPPILPHEQWEPGLKLLNTSDMFEIDNEYITIPQGPGLGMDINENALDEFRV